MATYGSLIRGLIKQTGTSTPNIAKILHVSIGDLYACMKGERMLTEAQTATLVKYANADASVVRKLLLRAAEELRMHPDERRDLYTEERLCKVETLQEGAAALEEARGILSTLLGDLIEQLATLRDTIQNVADAAKEVRGE